MATLIFIKTNTDGVVVEYHEYQDVPDDFRPTSDHVKLDGALQIDPVGRYHRPGNPKPFSDDYAPGFEPDTDPDDDD